ncbi:MAG: hypothetical protein EP348_04635 [Alphaproteobacteria bacterium]|nr:MAG: hypothetical protein EP348_04635 [Alphaproteobacteria bacterium]
MLCNHEPFCKSADFSAAIFFVIGNILFFYESTVFIATWRFLIGFIFWLAPNNNFVA